MPFEKRLLSKLGRLTKASTAPFFGLIATAAALDASRKALEADPGNAELQSQVADLEAKSMGITPELQISPSQVEGLNPQRRVSLANYIFAGAVIFMVFSALLVLFFGTGRRA